VSKKRHLTKKERKRLSREKAKREALAQEKYLARAVRIEELLKELRKKRAQDGIKKLGKTELGTTLAELLTLFKEENEYLKELRAEWERIRAHYPGELENLSRASLRAEIQVEVDQLIKTGAIKFTSKQKSEVKRSMIPGIGLIEREFGRKAEIIFGPPTCLDGIFRGGSVTIGELQELFGVIRQRFPGDLSPKGAQYCHRAVVMIFDALLRKEPSPPKEKGRPRRPWLIDPKDPDLRVRVLSRIEARIQSLEQVPENIAQEFLDVVRRHLALIREKNPV
jgi:hypothetical protein